MYLIGVDVRGTFTDIVFADTRVGSRSAGAEPGPAAHGRGEVEPTVTDANLVLDRPDPENFLGGVTPLELDAARRVVSELVDQLGLSLEEAAEGILTIVNANMANAISSSPA
jgi:N-methylhydantoinase A